MTQRSISPLSASVPVFLGDTANEAWSLAIGAFSDDGPSLRQPSRAGNTKELLHAVISIADPRQRWIPARQPAINPAFAIAEALWMLWGRNDAALPVFFNSAYPKFNGPGPTYGGAYGHRLRTAFGMDQLTRAANALATSGDSRQVVLQIWDGTEDLPSEAGIARRSDIPCNLLSMLKVRENRLHWTQVLRSNDLILGVPYNVVQFTMLQEIIAGWIGIDVGSYTHISDSLHMYERDVPKSGVPRVQAASINTDDLALPKKESEIVLENLEASVNRLIDPASSRVDFSSALNFADYPQAYGNLLAIMGASAARKRAWLDISDNSAAACTNPALLQLWEQWILDRPARREPIPQAGISNDD
jgi:thymidylate synthase